MTRARRWSYSLAMFASHFLLGVFNPARPRRRRHTRLRLYVEGHFVDSARKTNHRPPWAPSMFGSDTAVSKLLGVAVFFCCAPPEGIRVMQRGN